jgi:hypothetical protein
MGRCMDRKVSSVDSGFGALPQPLSARPCERALSLPQMHARLRETHETDPPPGPPTRPPPDLGDPHSVSRWSQSSLVTT